MRWGFARPVFRSIRFAIYDWIRRGFGFKRRVVLTDGEITKERRGRDPESKDERKYLAVFVHGWADEFERHEDLLQLIRDSMPTADILAPRYAAMWGKSSSMVTNTKPSDIAYALQRLIERAYEDAKQNDAAHPYDAIVLIGYSAGCLLLRKALVYALGKHEDHPFPLGAAAAQSDWAGKVERIVLLAGMNRGWTVKRKPEQLGIVKFLVWRLWEPIARLPIWCGFLKSLERGRPFVSNLRLQWIRLHRDGEASLPNVVQLLGSRDNVVSRDDNMDVTAAPEFIFIPVNDTGHHHILTIGEPPETGGQSGSSAGGDSNEERNDEAALRHERREKISEALVAPIGELKGKYQQDTAEMIEESQHQRAQDVSATTQRNIVFIMHGIRDNPDWCREVRDIIKAEDPNAYCVVSSYGHFSMFQFLSFANRAKKVRWFMDQYTEAIAQVENPDPHFIGHSNGTYLLARGFLDYKTLKMNRVAFAGSVVPSDYPWDELFDEKRIEFLRNDRASADWVVGIFPGFYQLLGKALPIRWFKDIGNGGFRGFDRSAGDRHKENYYFPGGHGAAVEPSNHQSLAKFILDKPGAEVPELPRKPNAFVKYASRLCWLVWLLLAALFFGLGYAIWELVPADWVVSRAQVVVAYVVLVFFILVTI